MTNHLANTAISLSMRTAMADLALALANAMIEQEIACFHNSRKHSPDEDSFALLDAAQDAIDNTFEIRKSMHTLAAEIFATTL
jgi:hypothetical protein